jgi:TP901 family phage tail tape measure protein
MSNSEIAQFATNAQKAAQSLSSSTLAFSDAALIYFQQGDKMATAMQKAEITMKAAAISFNSSAQDMSEYLTAIWNSYQVGESEMQKYVDIMANLGANTATSMEEISTALQKVAATANNVGVGMDQMSSIIATSASVTRQSAETIGTSWNTILSRIGGLKLGQTLEDGVDLNKYSKALRSVGIEILDAQGELREMGGVIDEIGQKWGTMSKAQQSALAQTIGGARQYTQMMAFFDNYKTYEVNLKIADDSQGALDKQFATWEKSWEAATGRMKNAW